MGSRGVIQWKGFGGALLENQVWLCIGMRTQYCVAGLPGQATANSHHDDEFVFQREHNVMRPDVSVSGGMGGWGWSDRPVLVICVGCVFLSCEMW